MESELNEFNELSPVIQTFISLICYLMIFTLVILIRLLLIRNPYRIPNFFGLIESLVALYIWSLVKSYLFDL